MSLNITAGGTVSGPDLSGPIVTPGSLRWSAAASSAGCCSYYVYSGVPTDPSSVLLGETSDHSFPVTLTNGFPYNYYVQAYDATNALIGTTVLEPDGFIQDFGVFDQDNFSFSSGWGTAKATSLLGGSSRYSTKSGASATYVTDKALGIVCTVGPGYGSFKLYLNGVYTTTVSTHATKKQYRRVVWARTWPGSFPPMDTVKIVNLATAGHPRVEIDGWVRLSED